MTVNAKYGILTAVILAVVGTSISGCSLIGYSVGGAIDGRPRDVLDTVSMSPRQSVTDAAIDSAANSAHFQRILKKAYLGEGSSVTVVTASGTYCGNGLRPDTVLALRREGDGHGREGLLPSDPVDLTIKDSSFTHIHGRVLRLQEGYIVLQADAHTRGFPFSRLNAIYLSDERVLSAQDLASPQISGRLVRVPLLILGAEPAPYYIPQHEVEQVCVASKGSSWGTGRIIGLAVGTGLDIVAIVALAESISVLNSFGTLGNRSLQF